VKSQDIATGLSNAACFVHYARQGPRSSNQPLGIGPQGNLLEIGGFVVRNRPAPRKVFAGDYRKPSGFLAGKGYQTDSWINDKARGEIAAYE
jgi:hypothetical protein